MEKNTLITRKTKLLIACFYLLCFSSITQVCMLMASGKTPEENSFQFQNAGQESGKQRDIPVTPGKMSGSPLTINANPIF